VSRTQTQNDGTILMFNLFAQVDYPHLLFSHMPNVLKIVVFPKEDGDATHIKNPNKIYDLS
jgi:hypothetical protein